MVRCHAFDTGMGFTQILFDIALASHKPHRLIVADAMRLGKIIGTVSVLSLDSGQIKMVRAFSFHKEPTSCLLKELSELVGIKVYWLAVEPERMPREVSPGLSVAISDSLPAAGRRLAELSCEEQNPIAA